MKIKQRIKEFAKRFNFVRKLWHLLQFLLYKTKHPISPLKKNKRKGTVIQMVHTLAEKDAIGNTAIEISKALYEIGIKNYIVYESARSRARDGVPISCCRFNKQDIVIYHMSWGCDSSEIFKKIFVKKKIMFYHNITPAKYFFDMPVVQKESLLGMKQLEELKDYTDLAFTVSKYNERELKNIGYKNTKVISIPNRINNLLKYKIDKLNDGIVKLITVGRVSRNKCIEDVISVFNEYHKLNIKSKLYIIGYFVNANYEGELKELICKLKLKDCVIFTGPISEQQLANYYSNANAYICMSEHEGFCVPLIEAAAFQIPVFAYDSSAVSETIKNNGYLFKNKDHYLIAKKIDDVLRRGEYKVANVAINSDTLSFAKIIKSIFEKKP